MALSEFMYVHACCDLCDKMIVKMALLLMSDHRRDGVDFHLVTGNVIFTSRCYTVMACHKYVPFPLNAKPKPC